MTERGSYLLLEPDMRVHGVDGQDLGMIAEVVADESLDIFRGIVLRRHGFADAVFVPGDRLVAVDGNIATFSLTKTEANEMQPVRDAPETNITGGPNEPLLR